MTKGYDEVVLDRLKVATMGQVGSYVLRNTEAKTAVDHLTGNLAVRLSSHVLADRLEPSDGAVSFVTWASWWQHTKAEHLPTFSRWLRRPPRARTVRVPITADNYATFPTCRMDYPPDLGQPVRLSVAQFPYSVWAEEGDDPRMTG